MTRPSAGSSDTRAFSSVVFPEPVPPEISTLRGLRTSEHGREYRVGYGIRVAERSKLDLELGIEAERRENPLFHSQEASGGTDQRVLGRATVQW